MQPPGNHRPPPSPHNQHLHHRNHPHGTHPPPSPHPPGHPGRIPPPHSPHPGVFPNGVPNGINHNRTGVTGGGVGGRTGHHPNNAPMLHPPASPMHPAMMSPGRNNGVRHGAAAPYSSPYPPPPHLLLSPAALHRRPPPYSPQQQPPPHRGMPPPSARHGPGGLNLGPQQPMMMASSSPSPQLVRRRPSLPQQPLPSGVPPNKNRLVPPSIAGGGMHPIRKNSADAVRRGGVGSDKALTDTVRSSSVGAAATAKLKTATANAKVAALFGNDKVGQKNASPQALKAAYAKVGPPIVRGQPIPSIVGGKPMIPPPSSTYRPPNRNKVGLSVYESSFYNYTSPCPKLKPTPVTSAIAENGRKAAILQDMSSLNDLKKRSISGVSAEKQAEIRRKVLSAPKAPPKASAGGKGKGGCGGGGSGTASKPKHSERKSRHLLGATVPSSPAATTAGVVGSAASSGTTGDPYVAATDADGASLDGGATSLTAEAVAAAMPENASSIFHILDRRVNLDSFPADASFYCLLRSWVQDDPYRQVILHPDLMDRVRLPSALRDDDACTSDGMRRAHTVHGRGTKRKRPPTRDVLSLFCGTQRKTESENPSGGKRGEVGSSSQQEGLQSKVGQTLSKKEGITSSAESLLAGHVRRAKRILRACQKVDSRKMEMAAKRLKAIGVVLAP